MNIYIPTCGRLHTQVTLEQLPPLWRNRITLVVQAHEYKEHVKEYQHLGVKFLRLNPSIRTLAPTRQAIIEQAAKEEALVMFDDDLTFATRRLDDPTRFRYSKLEDINEMLLAMEKALETYHHITLCPREGGNRVLGDRECVRAMRVLGYRANTVQLERLKFDEVMYQEDFNMTLNLLRRGYKNLMLHRWVHNQAGGSGAVGGCNTYRKLEERDKTIYRLAELHPGLVQVVEKQTKTAWGGQKRLDVVVQWKKAYERGV